MCRTSYCETKLFENNFFEERLDHLECKNTCNLKRGIKWSENSEYSKYSKSNVGFQIG